MVAWRLLVEDGLLVRLEKLHIFLHNLSVCCFSAQIAQTVWMDVCRLFFTPT